MIEYNTAIDKLSLKLRIEKKSSSALGDFISVYEELSTVDSGLNALKRRKIDEDVCWNKRWIEEIDVKTKKRNTGMFNDENKEIINTQKANNGT